MDLFQFTPIDFLLSWVFAMPYFIITKVFSQDRKLRGKELLYFVLASLFIALTVRIFQSLNMMFFIVSTDLSVILLIFFYFCKISARPVKESFILTFFSFLTILLAIVPTAAIVEVLFPEFTSIGYYTGGFFPFLIYILLIYPASISVALLAGKVLRKPLADIKQSGRWQSALVYIAVLLFFFYLLMVTVHHAVEDAIILFSWNSLVIAVCLSASLVCFIFYAKFQKTQSTLREKEIEHRTLLYYMDEIEHQQGAIRKFKHDYQNILSSMEIFFKEHDLDGLMQYYNANIKPASEVITQNDFALDRLDKIKVREIKGILTAKLILAQNLGLDAKFEAVEDIDQIPTDSVTLVRMLGIILDNAIEALEELDTGQLVVACYKSGNSVTFVVQNTCPPNMPPFSQLKQVGFSTKGEGRGLGLNNLWELAHAHPNITLQTNIADGNFIQKLTIAGGA